MAHIRTKKKNSPKIIRMIALFLAVMLQAAFLLIPSLFVREYLVHIVWVFELFSLIAMFYIVKSDTNPVYKIPWIVVLLLFPVFGWFLYLLYGRIRLSKKEQNRIRRVVSCSEEALRSQTTYFGVLQQEAPEIAVQAKYLQQFAQAPVFCHTKTLFFPLGDDMFPEMLQDLRNAQKFIFMEYFIVEEGEMLNPIIDILAEKVKKGVDVRFVYDSFGSILKAPINFVREMQEKGIQCYQFNSFRSIRDSRYNNRDHRKICVIDGEVAYTGGVNLADEYINRKKVYGHWKDTAIRLEGEAVFCMTVMFLALWDNVKDIKENFTDFAAKKNYADIENGYVIPYTDIPMDDEATGKNVYLNIINRAKHYVYIMTPYLIIDNVMMTALVNAAKNGIDVRIITPGIPDKKIVFMLTQSYYEPLVKAGVKIYEYTPGFVHAKIFVSDDSLAVVGTINLDYRSLTHHFENAVWMYQTDAVLPIYQDFIRTQEQSKLVTLDQCRKKSLIKRLLLPILRLFSPML